MRMEVPFLSLDSIHQNLHDEIFNCMQEVLIGNSFVKGKYYDRFTLEFAKFCEVDFCIGCGNGLDALKLILISAGIGKGDEVIVPAHTFIATALAVAAVGAKPVLVDVEKEYYCVDPSKLDAVVTERSKAIIMVHLYGQIGRWDKVEQFAKSHGLLLIEDAAQAHGAKYRGRQAGSMGYAGAFSFYPGKNLGALGDGGAVTVCDSAVAEKIEMLANYGSKTKYIHEYQGMNSRLDELQAAVLEVKLKKLEMWNQERREIARRYCDEINNPEIALPKVNLDGEPVWHIFALLVENAQAFQLHLNRHGIKSLNHYPVPVHLHNAFSDLHYNEGDFPIAEYVAKHEVSIPIFNGVTVQQVDYVIQVINEFK